MGAFLLAAGLAPCWPAGWGRFDPDLDLYTLRKELIRFYFISIK
jgi:hypothetical protein